MRNALLLSCLLSLQLLSSASGLDILYVSIQSNKVVSYDVSQTSAAAVEASASIFANTNLSDPQGLAFDSLGNLYVANNNSTISKFNSAGVYQSNITTSLNYPRGLAFDSSGNLYAVNYYHTISKFSPSGSYLSTFSSNMSHPIGIAFDSSGVLYTGNGGGSGQWISKFDTDGNYLGRITSSELSMPYGLAFDNAGNLFASNANNKGIAKFDASGGYLGSIPVPGSSYLGGLSFDTLGNLYVVDPIYSLIKKFDANGNFQFSWHTDPGPSFIAISAVPEPTSTLLVTVAAVGLLSRSRRKR